jgi:SRSO17 transposase
MDESPQDTEAEAGSILAHPDAQALLEGATLTRQAVVGCRGRLTRFLGRYLPLFYRREQRAHAGLVVAGLLSGLGRKTCEPIAREAGIHRKLIQSFVGSGKWDDEAVMAELRRHVGEELSDPGAVLVADGSGFPKKGTESCGVKRQWCGRLGKVENCQVGVFLAYAAAGGHAPLGRRLYLPADWADDPERRKKCHVPPAVVYKEKWRIALDLLDEARAGTRPLPHAWVAADDEFGRASAFRAGLRGRGERYVLDVPCNTLVRDLDGRRPPRKRAGRGRKREVPFVRADAWAARQPPGRWQAFTVRGGEKGPLRVEALAARVRAKDEGGHAGRAEERLLVVRTVEQTAARTSYCLSDAPGDVPLAELLRAHAERHRIERVIEEGKGEAGLGHYEVRSWVGWHHHMTLALLALWFLVTETCRLGGKNPGDHRAAGPRTVHAAADEPAAVGRPHCGTGHVGAEA